MPAAVMVCLFAAMAIGAEKAGPPAAAAETVAQAANPEPAKQTITATVKVIEGTVEWRPAVTEPWKRAEVGQVLPEGADLRTGFRAKCILDMTRSLVQMDALTVIRIAELKEDGDKVRTRLFLKQGRTHSIVEKGGVKNDFAIVTPSATLSVRGTQGVQCSFWDDVGGLFGLTGVGQISIQDLVGVIVPLIPGEWTSSQKMQIAMDFLSDLYDMRTQELAGFIEAGGGVNNSSTLPLGDSIRNFILQRQFTFPTNTLEPTGGTLGGGTQGGTGGTGGTGKPNEGYDYPADRGGSGTQQTGSEDKGSSGYDYPAGR